MAFAVVLSLAGALVFNWAFGYASSEVPLAAQARALSVLPPPLRYIASISLLFLQLVAICHSLYPLFLYLHRGIRLLTDGQGNCRFCHRLAIVGLVFIIAAAVPLSGSMETTSFVGSLISIAIYIIPAVAHMLYFIYRQHREVNACGSEVLTTFFFS
jgi:hypothetical protein